MEPILVTLVVFLAIFTQSAAGFGLALISMPLLIEGLGLTVAAPLIAIVAIVAEGVLVAYYRHAMSIATVWRLSLAAIIGIPVGAFVLPYAPERIVMLLLGLVVSGYSLYALLRLRLPELNHPAWAYPFGLIGGMLSGAYNTSGPPAIIYGTCRRWPPAQFKSNLQGYFMVNSIFTISAHIVAGRYTPDVLQLFLVALPGLVLGLILGLLTDRLLNAQIFRQVVLVLLLLIGLNLIF